MTAGTNTPEEKAGFIADALFSNSSSAAAGHKLCRESRLWRMSSMNKNVPANLAAAVSFTGIVVVFGPEAYGGKVSSYLMGDGLMLLGAFSAAIYSVFGRPVFGKYGPMFVMVLAVVFGVLALLPLAFASGRLAHWPQFSREGWLAVIFLGTVGAAIQFSLFTWALRWLPPSRAVIYLTLNPITAILLAGVMLREAVTPVLIVGLVLVIAGIFVANWRDADKGAPVKIGTIQRE